MSTRIISTTLTGLALATSAYADLASASHSTVFHAGFDFASVTNISVSPNGFASDVVGSAQAASIFADGTFGSTALTPLTQFRFLEWGRAASSGSFRQQNGFSTTSTRSIGDTATGQKSAVFQNNESAFSFVIALNNAVSNDDDFVLEFDWMMDGITGFGSSDPIGGDWLNVSYSADGSSYTNLEPNVSGLPLYLGDDYFAEKSAEDTWKTSSGAPAFGTFLTGQSDSVVRIASSEFTADGVSFTKLNPNTNDDIVGPDFYAADSANSWTASSTTGGLLTLASGQSNSAIDLTAAGNVQYIKFSVGAVNSGAELYLDNVSITGTVVPEPSTYAAIFGVVALAIAAYRRRK